MTPLPHCSSRFRAGLCWGAALAGGLAAQAPNEFDFDTTQLPVLAAASDITASTTYTGENRALTGSLTVRAGAELRLVRSVLTVTGNILMEPGSKVTVIDSSLLLATTGTTRYELRNEGGLLHTERAVIGSAVTSGGLFQSLFLHLRGTWLARQTVVQAVVTSIAHGRDGWFGNPLHKGGSVVADGLYEGDRTDAIQMSGMGDGVFANGTMNIGLHFDAAASSGPAAATIDLQSQVPLTMVYGDPLVHQGVTAPLSGHPCRIELRNHRSPMWHFFASNATSNGPLQTITLRHAEDIICNFRGTDLVGSPVLAGPWSSYYAELPGLPSTGRPGYHTLPPGCSVQLGNVKFQSGPGPNDGNRIRSWGLYSTGSNTNLTVTGPTLLAELELKTGGQAHLQGSGSFDMGVFANAVRIQQGANLYITNAAIGEFGIGSGAPGQIEAYTGSQVTIRDSRVSRVFFRTIGATSAISAQNLFGVENVIVDTNRGGTVQLVQAAANQDWDRQNLSFESPLVGGAPPFWSAPSLAGTLVADPLPGAPGSTALACSVAAATTLLQKHLVLPPQTTVSVLGGTKVLQAPATGQLRWQASQGAQFLSRAAAPTPLGAWQRLTVPLLTVGAGAGPVALGFAATGAPAQVRLDDVRVQVGSWWDYDNLANLDFEQPCRHSGHVPTYWQAPDCWRSFQVRCEPDAATVRPGASPGSHSVRMVLTAGSGTIGKDLSFLRPGDRLVVTGHARGQSTTPGAFVQALVLEGTTNAVFQATPTMACDGTWRPFTLNCTIPASFTYIRLLLTCFDAPGSACWFDDLTVEVQ